MIREITFEEIKPLWELLWPGRDDIAAMSTLTHEGDDVWEDTDMSIYEKYSPIFFGIFTDDTNELVAVNSCHPTSETRMRSRGLYVKIGYGGKGLGQFILQHTIDYSRNNNFEVLWSLPREKAIKTYNAVGFEIVGELHEGETWPSSGVMQYGTNYYVEKKL